MQLTKEEVDLAINFLFDKIQSAEANHPWLIMLTDLARKAALAQDTSLVAYINSLIAARAAKA